MTANATFFLFIFLISLKYSHSLLQPLLVFLSLHLCISSAEVSIVLKVDNRPVGRTHWRQLGTEACGQSFSIELERVSVFHFQKASQITTEQELFFSFKWLSILLGKPGFCPNFYGTVQRIKALKTCRQMILSSGS